MPSRRKDALSGFKYAQDGILHCFRTQKHMRYHFYTLIAVLLSGLLLNLDSRDMLVLVFAITLVIVAEMFNTVVEAVVDMITENYNPAAKIAKDVAAGAVLLSAMNAVIAGVLIFFAQKRLEQIQERMTRSFSADLTRTIVLSIVLLALVVIVSKLLSGTGATLWHGGIISGHSAVGFLLAMTIFFTAHSPIIAVLAILLAILVAQSRVEAGVHSIREVVLGAVLAILLTSLIYWVMPRVRGGWHDHAAHTSLQIGPSRPAERDAPPFTRHGASAGTPRRTRFGARWRFAPLLSLRSVSLVSALSCRFEGERVLAYQNTKQTFAVSFRA